MPSPIVAAPSQQVNLRYVFLLLIPRSQGMRRIPELLSQTIQFQQWATRSLSNQDNFLSHPGNLEGLRGLRLTVNFDGLNKIKNDYNKKFKYYVREQLSVERP